MLAFGCAKRQKSDQSSGRGIHYPELLAPSV